MILLTAVVVAGCTETFRTHTTPAPATPGVFDWLETNATNATPRSGGTPAGRNQPAAAEIYYGQGVESAALPDQHDSQGGITPATVSMDDLWRNSGAGSVQRAQGEPPPPAGGAISRAPNGNGISLNFENADIRTVARSILGDVLNLNYAIDPNVTGTISLSTRRPVRREQVLSLLENALRSQGAILVRQGGVYRIQPDKDVAGVGSANVGRDAGPEGFGITALPLQNISADALFKILDGFGARSGSVRIDPDRNLLVVQGTHAERESLIETALAFDVDWMRSQSVGIFPVRNASPDTVITELGKMIDPNVVRLQPVTRINAVLAVSKSPQAIQQVSTWIGRLDRMNEAGVAVRVYKLRYGDARRVAAIVRELFGAGGSGGQIGPGVGTDQVAPGTAPITGRVAAASPTAPLMVGRGATPGAPPPPTLTDAGGPGAPGAIGPDGATADAGAVGARIRVTADIANNAVVVYAGQPEAKLIEHAIRDLDRSPVQVSIEATIAEITLNDSLRNGVQFFLTFGKDRGSAANLLDVLPLQRVIPGFNLLLGSEANPKLVLDALREVTDVKVLSSPSLVVVDNQPAILQVGDQVPVTTRTAQDVTNPVAPIVNSIDFRDTGVILRVTPRVQANSNVRIEVEQEISAVKETTTTSGSTPPGGASSTLTPTISQRRVKSMVSVGDGQTLLLAGLISEQRNFVKSGIPGVVDIPVVGKILGGHHRDNNVRTELIVFIKPRVVRDQMDARQVAEDLRRRMKGFERW